MREKHVQGYYGSELNQLIDQECNRNMTCINIDCLLIKYGPDTCYLKIIESKKPEEPIGKAQEKALQTLKHLLRTSDSWDTQVCILRGEPPYRTAMITDIDGGPSRELTHDQLIRWLQFQLQD